MAAGAWKLFWYAKRNLGKAALNINTGATLKLSLHKTAASANLLSGNCSTFGSIGNEISTKTGYAAYGKAIPNIKWTNSGSVMKFTYTATGLIFTATLSAINTIRYAVIRTSTGAGAGNVICYCALSTAEFTLANPNTLTILPASGGVFTLA
jgi:hypothetical protein